MTARVAGRVKRTQHESRLAIEFDQLFILDQAVNTDRAVESFRRQAVRGDRDAPAQMIDERIDPSDMIRVQMRQDNLSKLSTFGEQVVNAGGERGLLIFVGRGRINDDALIRADDVTVRVRRRRQGLRADRKADEAGAKLYPAHG